jgi:hypothetical protein
MNPLADLDAPVREGVVLLAFVAVLLFGAVIRLMLRTRSLPVCWNCGFSTVHRAHSSRRPLDFLARTCFLYPYRCQRCLHRFYCFGSPKVRRPSGNKTMAAAAK